MIDYDKLKNWKFEPVYQTYSRRDAIIYALGLNIGHDPLDAYDLRYVAGEPPMVEPMMAMTLARLGPWMRHPETGIDYRRIVVGEVTLRSIAPLPIEGRVRGDHRVVRVTDKGEGRGALVTVLRELRDDETGELLAEYEQVTFCRAEGGFARDGRHDPQPSEPALPKPWLDGTRPDWAAEVPTSPSQALIYRLSGDYNPLHSDPETARKAGFERPILHGLATMGMAGHALARLADAPLEMVRGRLSAPVFPGDRLRLEAWRADGLVVFHMLNAEGREVLSNGVCKSK